jgi:hypothetical protein
MGRWFSKNLGDGMLAYGPLAEIEALFLTTYPQTDYPSEVALFVRHESEGRLHCEVKVYFPPAIEEFAQSVSAITCNKPTSTGLSLLVGSETALSTFFPSP